jgi:hypothetical protein
MSALSNKQSSASSFLYIGKETENVSLIKSPCHQPHRCYGHFKNDRDGTVDDLRLNDWSYGRKAASGGVRLPMRR